MDLTDDELVAELCQIDSGLTGWEVDFVESITQFVEDGGELSDAQRAKAFEILEEHG